MTPPLTEIVILLLPAITFVFLEVWDYITTVYAVRNGAYELNPAARVLLETGKLHELIYLKALHALFFLLVYVAGVVLYIYGKAADKPHATLAGSVLIALFVLAYLVGLIVISLNIVGLLNLL